MNNPVQILYFQDLKYMMQTPVWTYFEAFVCILANSRATWAPTLALFLIRPMSEAVLKKQISSYCQPVKYNKAFKKYDQRITHFSIKFN
jgi:hypothetical protein